jgi:hypothetical protein
MPSPLRERHGALHCPIRNVLTGGVCTTRQVVRAREDTETNDASVTPKGSGEGDDGHFNVHTSADRFRARFLVGPRSLAAALMLSTSQRTGGNRLLLPSRVVERC